MKKSIFMIISLIISILAINLGNSLLNNNNNNLGIVLYSVGVFLIITYLILLGYYLINKINDKNDILIPGIALCTYIVTFIAYIVVNYDFLDITLVLLFYISALSLITTLIIVFYYWNNKKKKKNIIYFIIISLAIIIALIIFVVLFKNLPLFVVVIIKFLYFTSVVLLFLYIVVLIIQKIIKP